MPPTSHTRIGRALAVGAVVFVGAALAACGAGSAATPGGRADPNAAVGSSGSGGGGGVAAACPVGPADAPFLVDGDTATRTYFATMGRRDVVFVRYDGHTLNVLDGCRDELAPGSLGAYGVVDEKAGPTQTLDVADAATMCAKLPLASAAFGTRVRGGEGLHLTYYVSGTRTATRAAIDERDLKRFPGCGGATHFVYAYDVGALALASAHSLTAPEQKAGDFASCSPSGSMGRTPDACMVPIRVALRPITPAAPGAPATPEPARITVPNDTETSIWVAQQKLTSRDGPVCIAALDIHDKLDARPHSASTDPTSGWSAMMRAQCLMLAGQCDAGKQLFRAAWTTQHPNEDASRTQTIVDVYAGKNCQGANLTPRDRFVRARMTLQDGAWTTKISPQACMSAYRELIALRTTVTPRDEDDALVKDPLLFAMTAAPNCLARAGDCDGAYVVYREIVTAQYPNAAWTKDEAMVRRQFLSSVRKCKS